MQVNGQVDHGMKTLSVRPCFASQLVDTDTRQLAVLVSGRLALLAAAAKAQERGQLATWVENLTVAYGEEVAPCPMIRCGSGFVPRAPVSYYGGGAQTRRWFMASVL